MLALTFGGTELAMTAAIVVLLALLIYLAISETALNRISLPKAEAMAEDQPGKSSQALLKLVREPEYFLNPVLVTVAVLQLGQAFLWAALTAKITQSWWGAVLGFLLNVIVFFVVTEAMPKTWAVLHSERAALLTARPTYWLVSFPPLRMLTRGLIGLTNVLLPGKGLRKGPFVTERELLGIVHAAADDLVIEHEERELIESIIEFGDAVVREIMVPRPDMVVVRADDTVGKALDLAIKHGLSRLPVLTDEAEEEDVIGVANAKDLARVERAGGADLPVSTTVRKPLFIPENKALYALMREMQARRSHMAIVVDEYGGIAGLVTLEDILEELVGEIQDEYDVEVPEVQELPGGQFLVSGGMSIDDLEDLIGAKLPDEDYETVGGFVFGELGHVPEPGEMVEHGGWRLSAEVVANRRIRQVRLAPASPLDDD